MVHSSPAVANGVVYVGSGDTGAYTHHRYGNVYALDAKTGAKLWSYTTPNLVTSSPAVANGVVYVGSDDGNVYAFGEGLLGAAKGSFKTPRPEDRFTPTKLSAVTISALASTLGVSEPYAADIRAGRHRPHPRHWGSLAKMVGVSPDVIKLSSQNTATPRQC
jgi:outer membrane protein assembly factor BamB